MKIWLTIIGVVLLYSMFVLAEDDDDGDDGDDDDDMSLEYGVVDGEFGTNCTCGTSNRQGERIVGGEESKKNEWPMIAELSVEGDHFCGGTLVTKRHIITAAHCGYFPKTLDELPYEKIDVYLGAHEIAGERAFQGARLYAIEEFRAHPEYHFIGKKYDIAVILLDSEVESDNGNIVPACLPTRREFRFDDQVYAMGWGLEKYRAESAASVLMKVKLNIVETKACRLLYKYFEVDLHLCIYGKDKDACQGDSGGPLVWRDPDTNRFTLVGATSYGKKCGIYPGVFANIMAHLKWIQQTISDTDPTQKTCAKVK